MDEVGWTSSSVIQLVTEYMRRPELWNREHDLHHVQTAKYEAWTAIARKFGCDIADLRRKMTSVLASYRREKGKVRGGVRSSWFLYPHLKFLPGYIPTVKRTKTADSPQDRQSESPEPIQEFDMDTEVEDEDMDPDCEVEEEEVMIKQEPVETPKKKKPQVKKIDNYRNFKRLTKRIIPVAKQIKQPQNQTDSKLLEMLRLLKKSDISKKKDECDSFGEYIATTLRKHDDRTQSMIKQAINNILFEQEMKKYTNQYEADLGDDVNPLDHEREDN